LTGKLMTAPLDEFNALVVPEMQKRGLYRSAYATWGPRSGKPPNSFDLN
jgi:hypothetical protein